MAALDEKGVAGVLVEHLETLKALAEKLYSASGFGLTERDRREYQRIMDRVAALERDLRERGL